VLKTIKIKLENYEEEGISKGVHLKRSE